MPTDKFRFDLDHPMGRKNAAQCLSQVPEGFICEIRKRRRLEVQNAKFHAMVGDIAREALFDDRRLSPSQVKVLLISAHAMVTGEGQDIVRGLEGEFVNIRESSAEMTVTRMASLIEFTSAWCATHGIRLSAGNGYEEGAYQR
jgi:hypothetical protein